MSREKIESLLCADEYEVLGNLYEEVTGTKAPGDVARHKPGHGYIYYDLTVRLFAALWFAEQREHLETVICREWDYCKRRNDFALQDRVQLCAAVADVIAGSTIGIPPFSIAVLLVRLGLASFCGCDGPRPPEDRIDQLVAAWVAKASGKARGHEDYYDRDWYRAYEWLGDRFFDAGRYTKAVQYYLEAVAVGGDRASANARLANQVAWTLCEVGRPLDAVGHAERAASLLPDDDAILDTLGIVHFACGEFSRSIEALERSIVVGQKSSPTWAFSEEADENRFHLVRSYVAAGRQAEARRVFGEITDRSAKGRWKSRAADVLKEHEGH